MQTATTSLNEHIAERSKMFVAWCSTSFYNMAIDFLPEAKRG